MYWETFHKGQLTQGQLFGSKDSAYEIINEWSSIGDYSLKVITNVTFNYGGWLCWVSTTGTEFIAKVDVCTNNPIDILLVVRVNNVEHVTSVRVPSGATSVTLDLSFDSEVTSQRIDVRVRAPSNNLTVTYLDNIRICKR